MSETVYLNGEFLTNYQATISPNDRGFIFADGIYEVVKYYNGKAFRFKDHLDRLDRNLGEIGIHFKETNKFESVFSELLARNSMLGQHAGIYLQITRGVNKRVHHFPKDITPTVYAFTFELPSVKEKLENGIKVITTEDIRWLRCDIKSVSLLPNTMLYNQSVENDAGECIMIRDGYVSEATHSSVCAVKNGVLITRPLSNLILPGITRKVVLEICATNNIVIDERLFTKEELLEMDEIFISGTGSEITPVIQVDDKIISNKKPGKITRLIQSKFFAMVP